MDWMTDYPNLKNFILYSVFKINKEVIMETMIGKRMTHTKTQETGVIITAYSQIRDKFDEIKDIPHVVWKSDVDSKLYASKLENILLN